MTPLDPTAYHQLTTALKSAPINTLFAQAVVDGKVNGKVYTDNPAHPNAFYIVHPYGMSLLWGDSSDEDFHQRLKDYAANVQGARQGEEWLQAFPGSWDFVLDTLFRDEQQQPVAHVERDTRLNFKFNADKYRELRKQAPADAPIQIKTVTRTAFESMTGTVIPAHFWNSADEFVSQSIGYSVYYDNALASLAFAAFINHEVLEIGIETCAPFRGKGLAYHACAGLIDYCLDRGLEPIWACRGSNAGSRKLAQQLGFEISKELPYYRLKAIQ
ncbi:GNAT family N-acetyltransferase [Chitinophaga sp. G-6-1-13]|uniref:GNAT family N-acetyltransferase n=1 Tax=Chitinophaga fulva TaxID=2728842 RepID=A0A848GM99_9BACT|nr:GNAT family N-acetyltransferase [Chitinophaga fulva]NML39526.1 GNAT family N-acetyltransferase [Chitinophaga fulva]